jgi:hypothetical protein
MRSRAEAMVMFRADFERRVVVMARTQAGMRGDREHEVGTGILLIGSRLGEGFP